VKNLSLKCITLLVVIVLFARCVSVQKYNSCVIAKHSPKELKKDVDFAYKKLKKFHPDLYWYISEDSLDANFNNLKNSITDSLTSRDFYLQFAPVLASIGQGHTSVKPPLLKQTREDKKEKGEASNIFKPFDFKNINNRLFITHNFGKDSAIISGVEIVSVDNQNINELVKSFMPLTTSDGYNKTFVPEYVYRNFDSFYTYTHQPKDSILLTLSMGDSTFNHYIKRQYVKPKEYEQKDSVKSKVDTLAKIVLKDTIEVEKLSKDERKQKRAEAKLKRQWKRQHGYNEYTKLCYRNFKFIEADSALNVAYMKIRVFTKGDYKKFYNKCFEQIDSAKCNTLVIDLRGNTGGRLSEIDYLYSFLTDKEYLFIERAKMTKRTSYLYNSLHSGSVGGVIGSVIFSPILITHNLLKVSSKDHSVYFKFGSSKIKKPKENNFKGKIYVLVDGMSFSASCILSTHLKATKRATFVGKETGGAYNGTVAGIFAMIELPASKLNIRAGLMTIKTPYSVNPDGYGIKPDVEITSVKFGEDNELNWVLNQVKNVNNK